MVAPPAASAPPVGGLVDAVGRAADDGLPHGRELSLREPAWSWPLLVAARDPTTATAVAVAAA